MSTFKKCQVVMLSTNEKAKIGDNVITKYNNTLFFGKKVQEPYNMVEHEQKLYILSDDEAKKHDFFITRQNIILKSDGKNHKMYEYKKIIASTDNSLKIHPTKMNDSHFDYLPQPSQSFIEKYVEEYNKDNAITDVMVEYNDWFKNGYDGTIVPTTIRINSKDNTITVRKVKSTWNKYEVLKFAEKYARMVQEKPIQLNAYKIIHNVKWIEENIEN